MIAAGAVCFIPENLAKFVDPIISIFLATFLLILNFPYSEYLLDFYT